LEKPKCSFCGKPYDEVEKLIAGENGVYICNECVVKGYNLLLSEERHNNKKVDLSLPSEIKAFLDEYIIGQEEAKIAISVAAYNHYKGSSRTQAI